MYSKQNLHVFIKYYQTIELITFWNTNIQVSK